MMCRLFVWGNSLQRSLFGSAIVNRLFASIHPFRILQLWCGLSGWLVFLPSRWWVFFWWFVWLYVAAASVCLHPSEVFMCTWVCLGVFCWLRWGRVYRAGPSRARISDPHIPEPPLIASVCCFPQSNPSPHLSWLHLSSFLSPLYYCPHPHLSIF